MPQQRIKGYRLLACDTTVQKLPNNEQNRKMGIHTNQYDSVASIKLSTYFDLCNKVIVRASLHDKRRADLRCSQGQIKDLPTDSLSVYDRAYGSHLLAFLHGHYGTKYVVRLRTDYALSVTRLLASGQSERWVEEPLHEKAWRELATMGIGQSGLDTIRYRLVRLAIPGTGETEVLMTNLSEQEFDTMAMSELYAMRWGVETSYHQLKNTLMLGTFSGYSALAVEQDIWCVVVAYNLQTILAGGCQAGLAASNSRRRKPYKLNRNVGWGSIRLWLKDLVIGSAVGLGCCIGRIEELLVRSVERLKPTLRERERKRIRNNDRHHTELNYKRGF